MRLLDGWLLFAVIGIALGANEMPLPVVFMHAPHAVVIVMVTAIFLVIDSNLLFPPLFAGTRYRLRCAGDDSGWNYCSVLPSLLVSSSNQLPSQVYSEVYFLSTFKECKLIEEHITSKVSKKVIRVMADYPGVDNKIMRYPLGSLYVYGLWISSASDFPLARLNANKGGMSLAH